VEIDLLAGHVERHWHAEEPRVSGLLCSLAIGIDNRDVAVWNEAGERRPDLGALLDGVLLSSLRVEAHVLDAGCGAIARHVIRARAEAIVAAGERADSPEVVDARCVR